MTLTVVSTSVFVTYLSTDAGRKFFMKHMEADENNPGRQGSGYSTKKGNIKKDFDEMDALRKINVQPIWEEKKPSPKD